jgi:dynein light chain LC8-type
MSDEMEEVAFEAAVQALCKYSRNGDIAKYIVDEFEERYTPNWHCIVGNNLGAYVTRESGRYISFSIGGKEIVLFKWR